MSEVYFYHLTQTRLEVALPKILERALSADWSLELRIGIKAEEEPISDAIWKGPDESFLPHCSGRTRWKCSSGNCKWQSWPKAEAI